MSFIVLKTRGILLQGCSSSRKQRETSCKLILHLRSGENKGFVRQFVLSTGHCRKCTMQKFTSCPVPFYVTEHVARTTQTLCQHITYDATRSRVAQVEMCAQNIFSFHLLFRAMSHDLHSTLSILSSFPFPLLLLLSPSQAQG